MDSRRLALALVQPLTTGDTIVPGVAFVGASAELGLRLRFETQTGPLIVEVTLAETTSRFAARTERIALAYRAGAGQDLDPKLGESVCIALAERIAHNEGALDRIEDESDAPRVREVSVDSALEWRSLGTDSHYAISPYVGCTIGCSYCYAQTRLGPVRRLLRLPEVAWGSYVDARINLPEILEAELQRLEPGTVKFCPIVSDPYQALETKLEVTGRCLDVLADAPEGWRVMLLTRSSHIARDLDRLRALRDPVVGVSLPTVDEQTLRHFEPRAATAAQRLEVLAMLRDAGIRTMAVVQPILPGPLDRLAEALARVADSVSVGVLEGEAGAASWFDAPPYRDARDPAWQRAQAEALRDALGQRGIPVWRGELPPETAA